jgi:protein-disulfide isomerase
MFRRVRRPSIGSHAHPQRGLLTLLRVLVLLLTLLPSPRSDAQGVQLISAEGQRQMLLDPGTPLAGAPRADLTIVEYLDFNCPYCRKFAPILQEVLAQDGHVAVLYKDWPILGESSVYAARLALAAHWQGQYLRAHDALMQGGRLGDDAAVHESLRRAGFDVDALRRTAQAHSAQIDALLERNDNEAHALGLRGTPGIIVGRLLLPGIVDADGLRQLLTQARQAR